MNSGPKLKGPCRIRVAFPGALGNLWLGVLSLSLGVNAAAGAPPVRLAIVPEDGAVQAAGDLLTATLTSRADTTLLERARVAEIQREQQLSADNVRNRIRLGEALGADGLLTLNVARETDATNLYLRLIAVRSGVTLRSLRYPWPLGDVVSWSQAAAQQFGPLIPKLAVLPKDAVPVSILNLRSAAKSAVAERLEQELTLLLINRLSWEREVFVLERQRLAAAETETELKGAEQSAFWSGSYLIEGTLDPAGFDPDRVTIEARLIPPRGGRPEQLDVTGPRHNLPAVAEKLASGILARLRKNGGGVGVPWDAAAEATRYLAEANWALRWKVYAQAQWAADSAWALGRHDLECACLKVRSYSQAGEHVGGAFTYNESTMTAQVGPVYPQLLDGLSTALENAVWLSAWFSTNTAASARLREDGFQALSVAAEHLRRYWFNPDAQKGAEDKLDRLRTAARSVERLLLDGDEHPTPGTYQTAFGKRIWQLKVRCGWLWYESADEVLQEYRRLLESGLSEEQRRQFLFRYVGNPVLVAWTPRERALVPGRWQKFLDELSASTNLTIELMGRLLHHQMTPKKRLSEAPDDGSYDRSAKPICAALLRHREELVCRQRSLLLDALQVLDRRVAFDWEPPPGMRVPNAARDLRTNLMQFLIERADCFSEPLAARLFRPAEFESEHLLALLRLVVARSGTETGQVPRLRQAVFKAQFASRMESDGPYGGVLRKPKFREALFRVLFEPTDYQGQEGQEVLSAMQSFQADMEENREALSPFILALSAHLQKTSSPSVAATSEPSVTKTNDSSTLTATLWQAVGLTNGMTRTESQRFSQLIYRDGRLWFDGMRRWVNVSFDRNVTRMRFTEEGLVWSVDLRSWSVRSNSYTSDWVGTDPMTTHLMEVVGDTVYRVGGENLWALSPRDRAWRKIPVPVPPKSQLLAIEDRIYVGASDSLLEIEPLAQFSRVIASGRRRPPVNEVDQLANYDAPAFCMAAPDTIFVALGDSIRLWNKVKGEWSSPLPQHPSGFGRRWYADNRQIVFMDTSEDGHCNVWRLGTGGGECLFSVISQAGAAVRPTPPGHAQPSKVTAPTVPKWRAGSGQLRTLDFSLAPDGDHLWCTPRTAQGSESELWYYDARRQDPLRFKVQFGPTNPVPSRSSGFFDKGMELFAAPEGLVLCPTPHAAFWFIGRGELERATKSSAGPEPERTWTKVSLDAFPSASGSGSVFSRLGVDCASVVRKFDRNGDGRLNLGELAGAIAIDPQMASLRPGPNETYSRRALIIPFDMNQNGGLEPAELARLLDSREH